MDCRLKIKGRTLTLRGSDGAPTMSSLPFGPSPPANAAIDFAFGAVARITRAPPRACSSLAGSETAVSSQRLFVLVAADGYGAESHALRILNAQVTQPSDALHGDQVSGTGANVAQRVVGGDSGAQQRGSLVCGQFLRHQGHRFGGRDHVLRVASIEVNAGDLLVIAQDEVAPAARFADEVMAAVPAHAHALADFPVGHVRAEGVHATGNLVSRNAGILQPGPMTVLDQDVTVADAAGFHFDTDRAGSGLGNFALHDFERASGLADLGGFHGQASFLEGNGFGAEAVDLDVGHEVSDLFTMSDNRYYVN
jgi:hypothetical protein